MPRSHPPRACSILHPFAFLFRFVGRQKTSSENTSRSLFKHRLQGLNGDWKTTSPTSSHCRRMELDLSCKLLASQGGRQVGVGGERTDSSDWLGRTGGRDVDKSCEVGCSTHSLVGGRCGHAFYLDVVTVLQLMSYLFCSLHVLWFCFLL